MEPCLQLNFRKILLTAIVLLVVVTTLTLLAFMLGQENGMRLATVGQEISLNQKDSHSDSPSPEALPVLPKAMTATPASKLVEKWSLSNEQATQYAQEQNLSSVSGEPVVIKNIQFTPSEILLMGQIDYAGYVGALDILGYPVVEAQALHFRVSRLIVDGQDLPQMVFAPVEAQVDHFLAPLLAGYDVIDIELGDGFLAADILSW
jgi:hypothetical protein